MFNIFKKKTPKEIEMEGVLKVFKNIAKEIRAYKGLHLEVCINFVKFISANELFKSTGIISEDESPYPKTNVMLSGLMLLGSLRQGSLFDNEEDVYLDLAKMAFITSSVIIPAEELQPLLEDAELLVNTRDEFLSKHEQAWEEWLKTDSELLIKISNF